MWHFPFGMHVKTHFSRTSVALLLSGASLVALIWAVVIGRIGQESEQAFAQEITRNTNLALAHAARANQSLQLYDQTLLALRNEFALHGMPHDLNARLAATHLDRRVVGVVSLIDARGEVIATTADGMALNFADRDYFKAHATDSADRLLIGKPIQGRLTNKTVISLTRRLNRPDGAFAGVVFMAIEPIAFASDYRNVVVEPHAALALIGLDGITRVRRNNGKISYGEDIRASQLFKELPKARSGDYIGVAASDGQKRVASYQVLDDYPMVVVVASSLNDVEAALQGRKQVYLGAAIAASLLVMAFAVALGSMLITRRRDLLALKSSEERFRSLTELSSDWYWEQDARFRFVRMDGNLELSTGITNEDHVGRTRWDMPTLNLSAADWAAHKAMLEAHLPFQRFEMQRPDKGGRKHWVAISGTPIFAADGSFTGYRGIGVNITQHKQAEQLLVTSKLEMQRVLNAAPAQIILCDSNERYQLVNQAYADLMERPISEIIGRTLREVVGEGVYLLAKPHIRAVLAGNTLQYERTQQRADGSVRVLEVNYAPDIDANGTVCGWFGMHRDITEERSARTRIAESEERFRTLTEWSPEAILVHRDGTVIYANPAAATLLRARSAEQIIGATFVDLIAPGYHPISQRRIDALLGGALHTPVTEMQFLTFDAGIVDVEIQGTYLAYDGKMAVHVSLHDITLRKNAQATAASLEVQLRESQKMEAIGTLAGGIAHDFNNIIATILGNAALARTDAGANPEVQQSLEEIRKAGARARDLVQQILSFSRRQPTQRKPQSLAPIIEESVRLLRATLPARVALEAHCAAGVPAVLADATQIEQVIINLATNAMQAMHGAPGRISLHLDALPLDDALADAHPALRPMHAQHAGRVVRLVVSDDGQGMEAAVRERIFEPFFTTKAVDEGTGLGLSVVHGIIQMHEGVITVESEVGKGTSFTLYLRATEADAAATATLLATTTAAPPTPTPGAGRHILYLDDDDALVSLTQRLLERRGYRISSFVNQEKALAALRADPAGFDLVLTDYNMPGMSGLDVARAVRAIRADLPVVVASGFIDETLRSQAGGAGVRELIFKATDIETFCAAVQRLAGSLA